MKSKTLLSVQCDGMVANGANLLRPFHFELKSGSAMALIGKNGSGKTTLLKHLSGATQNYKFTMQFQGEDWNRFSIRDRATKIGWLPQRLQYLSDFTVLDLALLGRFATHRGFPTKDDIHKCESILELLEILPLKDRRLAQLSGGELQRAALARVFSSDVKLMVLDEPFSGLDVDSSLTVLRLIQKLCEDGKSIVYSLHGFDLLSLHKGPLIAISQDQRIKRFETVKELDSDVMKSIFLIDVEVYSGKNTYFHIEL